MITSDGWLRPVSYTHLDVYKRQEPYTPPEMQMANSLLKHNELTPAWIADRNVVLAAIEQFRKKVRNGASAHLIALAQSQPAEELIRIEQHWQKQLAVWREEILILNHRIDCLLYTSRCV